MLNDIRFAARLLRKSRGFTAVAVLSLALGIGANVALFGLMNALMWRDLPVERPGELMLFDGISVSNRGYRFVRDHGSAFTGVFAASHRHTVEVDEAGKANASLVTGDFFSTLGVPAALGRTLQPEDDRTPGDRPVVVLSFAYWQRRFARDPLVLGRQIRLGKFPFTIVGVAAHGFRGVDIDRSADLWVPAVMQQQVVPGHDWLIDTGNMRTGWLDLFARLKPGVSLAEADAAAHAVYMQYEMDRKGGTLSNEERREIERESWRLVPAGQGISGLRARYSPALGILMAAALLVLLIACANLANLLLARSGARRSEIGVRLALGAGRGRLIRQLLVECLLLAAAGAALGALIAWAGQRALLRMLSATVEAGIDWRSFAAALVAALGAALTFGLLPALRAASVDLAPSLRSGRGETGSREGRGLGRLLTVAQVALCLVLLVGAGLFLRTLANLRNQDLGLQPDHLVQLEVDGMAAGYKGGRYKQLCRSLTERLAGVPGVRQASFSLNGLFTGGDSSSFLTVRGFTTSSAEEKSIHWDTTGPGYFTAIGTPFNAGRDFTVADSETAAKVIIVNESMAHLYFSGRNPLGEKVSFNGEDREVVGVVKDSRDHAVRTAAPRRLFVPFYQVQWGDVPVVRFLLRTSANPDAIIGMARQAVKEQDAALAVDSVDTVSRRLDRQLARERALATLSGYFGVLALLVAAVGLYGVVSYNVARRTREIGVRVALGALRRDVVWLMARESLVLVAAGIAIGLGAAWGLSRFVAALLFGVKPADGVAAAWAIATLLAVTALAAIMPAKRAAAIDPASALREE